MTDKEKEKKEEIKKEKFNKIVFDIGNGARFKETITQHWSMVGFHGYISKNGEAHKQYERCLVAKAGWLMAEYESLLFDKDNEEMHFSEKKVKLDAIDRMLGWLDRERYGKHMTKKVEGGSEAIISLEDIIKNIQKG